MASASSSAADYNPSTAKVVQLDINLDKLPSLPELPESAQQVPFLHKSFLLAQQGPRPNGLECELTSNQRMGLVGNAVLALTVTSMLVRKYSHIGPASISHARKSLLCNALFSRLALAYGLDKRLQVASELVPDDKIYADTFEAYIGTLYEAVESGDLPTSILHTYFAELYSVTGFPNLNEAVDAWQNHRLTVKKSGHFARSAASEKKKNKMARPEQA